MLLDVVREALGGHAHRVLVHPVGAHAHDAAEAAGAEFQVAVEGVFQPYRIGFLQFLDFCLGFGVEVPFEPALDHFLVIFHKISVFSVMLVSCKCKDYCVFLQCRHDFCRFHIAA